MTVIVWDGTSLAADRRSTRGGTVYLVRKVHRVGNLLIGLTGGTDFASELLAWIERGRRVEDWPANQKHDDYAVALMIDGGRTFTYDRSPYPVELFGPHIALGAGREVALGALWMGATAKQAVLAACDWCDSCGNGVDVLELA